jgi:threonine aldolase
MYKHCFFDDYSEGAHPRVLELLAANNLVQESGYGEDSLSRRGVELLRTAIGQPDADIHFVSGGTQANLIALASMLRPYESVIAASTSHIHVHETGAVEATGHKINLVAGHDGKLLPEQVRDVVAQHADEHMVAPRVVFISQATEAGTLYRKAELEALSRTCRELGLHLYLDGARLGCALASDASDLSLPELATLVDMFYLGGTKNGALLAKGRVIGAQFVALFEDGLYFQLARHANVMAARLAAGLRALDVAFLTEPVTNQVFPILADARIATLRQRYGCHVWARIDEGRSAIRLVTSWATQARDVDAFIDDFRALRD